MAPRDNTSSSGAPASADAWSRQAEDRIRSVPGLRLTAQRREVLAVLLDSRDHPGATEIHQRASGRLENLSLATVYNCLDTLVEHGAVQQVTGDRHSARYCANLAEHAHFYCTGCGQVSDLEPASDGDSAGQWQIPAKAVVSKLETSVHGLCAACATRPAD